MGLLWMAAKGYMQVIRREEMDFYLVEGAATESENLTEISVDLKSMLVETAAYRAYFQTAPDSLT